ncbi:MAG: hypothetical protein LBN38_05855 [Verrucomicrobiota bacterium]|jgi:hypothetical protein|nr:hypothetical protein [Verrucomicrobiota bacterium]
MTEPMNAPVERQEPDVLPPESGETLPVPPPVPAQKPGFLRRLFTSRKKQQAVAVQNGYLEMVDLIRAIRSHLDRQEAVQTSVLSMLEKVPGTMDRQNEVMNLFKQQLENNMENDQRLTENMGKLNSTLSSMDESQRASAHTITDLIHRSRESEQLLREVMRRAERRMTVLMVLFLLLSIAAGFYFFRLQKAAAPVVPAEVEAVVLEAASMSAPEEAPRKETPTETAELADEVESHELTVVEEMPEPPVATSMNQPPPKPEPTASAIRKSAGKNKKAAPVKNENPKQPHKRKAANSAPSETADEPSTLDLTRQAIGASASAPESGAPVSVP